MNEINLAVAYCLIMCFRWKWSRTGRGGDGFPGDCQHSRRRVYHYHFMGHCVRLLPVIILFFPKIYSDRAVIGLIVEQSNSYITQTTGGVARNLLGRNDIYKFLCIELYMPIRYKNAQLHRLLERKSQICPCS